MTMVVIVLATFSRLQGRLLNSSANNARDRMIIFTLNPTIENIIEYGHFTSGEYVRTNIVNTA